MLKEADQWQLGWGFGGGGREVAGGGEREEGGGPTGRLLSDVYVEIELNWEEEEPLRW